MGFFSNLMRLPMKTINMRISIILFLLMLPLFIFGADFNNTEKKNYEEKRLIIFKDSEE